MFPQIDLARITIAFLTLRVGQKDGSMLQPHVDYNVTILKDGKKEFQISPFAGQRGQSLHTDNTRYNMCLQGSGYYEED
ncbi:MAG TPA: hypothetical protein VEL11_10905 [Candidatus Bathyarchaeia archaeon]|nr:hypothetical protein [Candidatus Bathyarchaeia archaeon]